MYSSSKFAFLYIFVCFPLNPPLPYITPSTLNDGTFHAENYFIKCQSHLSN